MMVHNTLYFHSGITKITVGSVSAKSETASIEIQNGDDKLHLFLEVNTCKHLIKALCGWCNGVDGEGEE